MGLFKKIGKKFKKVTKAAGKGAKFVAKTAKKAGQAAAKVAKKGVQLIKNTLGYTLLLPLLPFKGAMSSMLKKKGKPSGGSLHTVVTNFYNTFVAHKGNFDGYEPIAHDFFEKHPAFQISVEDADQLDEVDSVDPVSITMIVTAVVSYFKKAKKSVDAVKQGIADVKSITNDTQMAAAATNEVEKGLEKKEKGTAPATVASVQSVQTSNKMTYIIIGAVILVAVVIFMRK